MKTKEEIRDEVISIHPYKVPGRPETYDQYNQGWEDACYAMEEKLQDYADQETAELKRNDLNYKEQLKEALNDNASLRAEIAQLRSRLDDCKRKAITGQRI